MKKILMGLKSYLIFFITVSIVVSVGILLYSWVKELNETILSVFILLYILFAAFVFFLIDYIRRNVIINKPLNDIIDATNLISKGDFEVYLKPRHSYSNFDELDIVMVNINKMAKELRKEEILKNDFISNFSHEVKTPVAVINGYASILLKKNLSEEDRKDYLDKLYTASSNLSLLITNILKLNKLDNNERIELTDVNLTKVLENVIVSFSKSIEEKNISLDLDIDEKVTKFSNESLIQIIFSNLVSNAIKFSNENSKLEIKLKNSNTCQFIVNDYGIGMTEETISHIFNRFYQGDTSHKTAGNGLGLSMVKKAIEKLEYKISIESELGKGTTFIVEIR